jgi:hypothetical protein
MPTAPAPMLSTTLSSLLKIPAPLTMKHFSCFAVIERQGREQRYRFYTAANWKAIQNDQATTIDVDDGAVSQDEVVAEEINEMAATEQEHKDSRIKRKLWDDGQLSKTTDEHSDIPLKPPKKSRVKSATFTKKQKKSRSASEIKADNDAQVFDEVEFGYGGMCYKVN